MFVVAGSYFLWSEIQISNLFSNSKLTHSLPMTPSLPPENIRKPESFMMFAGGREMMNLERMG